MSHEHDQGYELQSSLLVDASNGLTIAPLSQTFTHADGVYSTFNEGNSVANMRQMQQQGYQWLIRAKEGNFVEYQGQNLILSDVADQTDSQLVKRINYKGKIANLIVGSTHIRLTRKSKPTKTDVNGKRLAPQQGLAVEARLIVATLLDDTGQYLTRWTLLSNVSADELAQWYYWRWTVESFFKLIKSAGHDVESWLQTTPASILRRLLIASMACVLTWRIQRQEGEKQAELRQFLVRLTGRQQKRGRLESAPAILAGLSTPCSCCLNTRLMSYYYSLKQLSGRSMLCRYLCPNGEGVKATTSISR